MGALYLRVRVCIYIRMCIIHKMTGKEELHATEWGAVKILVVKTSANSKALTTEELEVYVCMHLCMCIRTYACECVCTYIYVFFLYVHTYICIYIYSVRISTNLKKHVSKQMQIHIYLNKCIYIFIWCVFLWIFLWKDTCFLHFYEKICVLSVSSSHTTAVRRQK